MLNSETLLHELMQDPRIDAEIDQSKLTPEWMHQLMVKHNTRPIEMRKAIHHIRHNTYWNDPCKILESSKAFLPGGICNAQYLKKRPEYSKDEKQDTPLRYTVKGYKQADYWLRTIPQIQHEEILTKIQTRLQQLGFSHMTDDPFSYALGQALLVHWYEFCQNPRKQHYYQEISLRSRAGKGE